MAKYLIWVGGKKAKMLSWSHCRENSTGLLANKGNISFGTPIINLISESEKEFNSSGSGLKILTVVTSFDWRRDTMVDGGGRLFPILP